MTRANRIHTTPAVRNLACGFCAIRRLLLAAGLGVIVSALGDTAFAQQSSANAGEDKILMTAGEGWPIHITYFKSKRGKESPAVVLLHNKGGNRLVWHNGFAQRLNDAGFAVVTVDLRKHGQSTGGPPAAAGDEKQAKSAKGGDAVDLGRNDYQSMITLDLEAVKAFLYDEHQQGNLNMRKTALVAPEFTAPIALTFAWRDWLKKPHEDAPTLAASTPRGQDIQAFVFISPESTVTGVTDTPKAIGFLKNPDLNLSFLFIAGSKDKLDKSNTQKLFNQVKSSKNDTRVYLQELNNNLRGTDLIGKELKTEDYIQVFLEEHLLSLDGPLYEWRDRKPRTAS